MSKHTKESWEWVGDTLELIDTGEAVLYVEDLPEHAVSEMQVGTLIIPEKKDRILIAAAPNLLEALKELVDIVQGVFDGDEFDSFVLQPARKSIAQAECNNGCT